MTTHKLICGDVRKIQPTLSSESVHLIITSPPYNVGVDYGIYKDNLPTDEYIFNLTDVFLSLSKMLAPGGHICINLANTGRQPYTPKKDMLVCSLLKTGWDMEYRGEIIWDKHNMTAQCAWGSWLSPNMPSIRDRHEYVIVFRKPGARKGETDLTDVEFMNYTQSIWQITPETDNCHPAPYPEELVERLIKLYSFLGETIYDPFVGSGTTSYVSKKFGRSSIGCDINPDYIKMSQSRLARLDGSIEQNVKPMTCLTTI